MSSSVVCTGVTPMLHWHTRAHAASWNGCTRATPPALSWECTLHWVCTSCTEKNAACSDGTNLQKFKFATILILRSFTVIRGSSRVFVTLWACRVSTTALRWRCTVYIVITRRFSVLMLIQMKNAIRTFLKVAQKSFMYATRCCVG